MAQPSRSSARRLAPTSAASAGQVTVGSGASLDLGTGTLDLGCADFTVTGTLSAGSSGFTQAWDVTIQPGCDDPFEASERALY